MPFEAQLLIVLPVTTQQYIKYVPVDWGRQYLWTRWLLLLLSSTTFWHHQMSVSSWAHTEITRVALRIYKAMTNSPWTCKHLDQLPLLHLLSVHNARTFISSRLVMEEILNIRIHLWPRDPFPKFSFVIEAKAFMLTVSDVLKWSIYGIYVNAIGTQQILIAEDLDCVTKQSYCLF